MPTSELLRRVAVKAVNYPTGHVIEMHQHRHAQLVYAVSGVVELTTERGLWLVPPQRSVWIPPEIDHRMRARGPVMFRTVYIHPDVLTRFPDMPRTVAVTPLLKELILRGVEISAESPRKRLDDKILDLLLEELAHAMEHVEWAPEGSLPLPSGRDKRLVKVCQAVLDDPGCPHGLEEWGHIVGASKRTMARRFQSEFGMSFLTWRQQARVFVALSRLGQGDQVTTIANDLGYDDPAAFAAMFRRVTGVVPSRYFSLARAH